MPFHTGIDIIEIERIERAIERWGERFLRRIYTDSELNRYARKVPSLAARFAAKEAVIKLLGKNRMSFWREIEVLGDLQGQPVINLYGQARLLAENLNIQMISVSLSHSKSLAIASACAGSD